MLNVYDFTMSMNNKTNQEEMNGHEPTPSPNMGGVRILIVEDEYIEAIDVQRMLVERGYDVAGIVKSGEECLDAIPSTGANMVLMDIELGVGMDGIDTAERILDRWNIPVIFISSYADSRSLERAKLTEPYGYINKPVNEKELYISIEMSMYRSAMDARLRESEERYRTLFEHSRDAIFISDRMGNVVGANRAMTDLLGYSHDELKGVNLGALMVERSDMDDAVAAIERDGYINELETRMRKKNGEEIQCSVTSTATGSGGGRLYQGIIRDITEKMRLLRELSESGEKMKNLSSHLQIMREEERKKIAREIHDVLGQSLTALKMDIMWLRNRLPAGENDLRNKSIEMIELSNSIIESVRKISAELRPGILDDLGLCAAIEWYMDDFQKRSGISATVVFNPPDLGIEEVRSIIIYRILQEAATNVLRHAGASEIRVSLSRRGDESILTVSDNGRGITDDQIRSPLSYGLIGIKERVESCGGRLELSGEPGMGTILRVIVPYGEG